ncbi:hypothetical protein K435DRAFT_773143 [Dendrothele bispora CBS 962.96]|uniref:Uncharacterized protein n=1 Tax=Dendrothele bispora (strain CBS 962.96) TaxID=1314807 RepID=A0A4S8MTB2_DENBC|nr:hypothetical protein K435DRAFT_773143 [Dendrothele bispora CBS 962.96]
MPSTSASRPTRSRPSSSTSTTTSTATLPEIPLELVLLILQHANDRPTYASASLVCRAWSLPAQQSLFHTVSLSSQSSCLSFLNAISSSPVLASSVRSLSCSIDHNQPYGLTQSTFAKAFSHCTHVDDLRISLYGCAEPGKDVVGSPDVARMRRLAPSWDSESLSMLQQAPSSSRVTKLKFCNWSDNRQSLSQLLDVFTSVQHLVLIGTPPEMPVASSSEKTGDVTPLPPKLALSSLRVNFQSYPTPDYFQWLLHTSSPSVSHSLRSLSFDRVPPTPVLEYLLNTHRETLESLSLPALPVSPILSTAAIVTPTAVLTAATTGSAAAVATTPATGNSTKAVDNSLLGLLHSLPKLKCLAIESAESFIKLIQANNKSVVPWLTKMEKVAFGLEVHAEASGGAGPSTVGGGSANGVRAVVDELKKGMKQQEQGDDEEEIRLKEINILMLGSSGFGSSSPVKFWPSLKMTCAVRGIELGLERDVRKWRESVVEGFAAM